MGISVLLTSLCPEPRTGLGAGWELTVIVDWFIV